jgi:hypothetical protein
LFASVLFVSIRAGTVTVVSSLCRVIGKDQEFAKNVFD